MAARKPKSTADDIVNWWLDKYHSTSIAQLLEENPAWAKEPEKHTREFYQKYQVTQEQHDEWYEWFITTMMKEYRMGRKRAERDSAMVYLNVAPSIKQ